jgi:hypothetical protein
MPNALISDVGLRDTAPRGVTADVPLMCTYSLIIPFSPLEMELPQDYPVGPSANTRKRNYDGAGSLLNPRLSFE